MTRVLYLIKTLGRGGAERLLMDVALRLDRSRFSVEIAYASDAWDELAADCEAAGLRVTYLGGRRRHLSWLTHLRQLLRQGRHDVLHVHSPYVAAGARLLPRGDRRLIYTEHNEWSTYHPATRWANALTYWRDDRILTVSDRVRNSVRYPAPLRFLPTPPLETLYHGVDLGELLGSVPSEPFPRGTLGIPDDALLVGCVAHFRPEKGHEVLLEAATRVHASLPGVRFVLVGGGPTEPAVRERVAALGLEEVVAFAGYRDDVAHLATAFDLFVLPSFREGLPIALIESMALAKPVVATDAGGTPEVVTNGRQGLIVPTGDPGALAEALLELLNDPDRRARMGREARMRAGDFDINRTVARLEAIYSGEQR